MTRHRAGPHSLAVLGVLILVITVTRFLCRLNLV